MLVLASCLVSFVMMIMIDALTPVGVATGVLYIIPVGMTLWSKNRQLTYIVAVISSFLDPIGYFVSPTGVPAYYVIFNRSIGLMIIWLLAALVIQRKYTEEAMGRAVYRIGT